MAHLRDFLVWDNFTPATITTGGTVTGSIPNPIFSPAGLLTVNTTTGVISAGFPAATTANGWLVKIDLTLECITPYANPIAFEEVILKITPHTHNGTVYYEAVDWGCFGAGYSATNQTLTTSLRGAYSSGGLTFYIDTSGIAVVGTDNLPTHRRIHISFDAVDY